MAEQSDHGRSIVARLSDAMEELEQARLDLDPAVQMALYALVDSSLAALSEAMRYAMLLP
jgi:hypothetical protein